MADTTSSNIVVSNKIKVVIRVRPLLEEEIKLEEKSTLRVKDNHEIE